MSDEWEMTFSLSIKGARGDSLALGLRQKTISLSPLWSEGL
ncbi:hypothetical protein OCA8868_01114 [Octadecabacter ascidiaceicola]|uniref:Uncharacterized protein n=1 Tax=Octadecabacter ascidiaceicola TaxID=1655543 RepID=A0A238K1N1_9RHOB|nr:hypothetical protein OCA8868_01114 [Octadecabacter ascidiaceicola]